MILSILRIFMPKNMEFVNLFTQQAEKSYEASGYFKNILSSRNIQYQNIPNVGTFEENYQKLMKVEKEADALADEVVRSAYTSFITPFDRADILDLSNNLDDIIDYMKKCSNKMSVYNVDATLEMIDMAGVLVEACAEIQEIIPLYHLYLSI